MPLSTRRAVCGGLLAAPLLLRASHVSADAGSGLAEIERGIGGRLGVCVGGDAGPVLGYRAEERFPMCSTFKVLAVAAVLARVDAGTASLDRILPYGPADLLSYAPMSRAALEAGGGTGRISVSDACAAAVVWSDNTAANLLLALLGGSLDDGPAALTAWLRGLGDGLTRLDRTEPTLNSAIPDDPRDTTTPAAMQATLARILTGSILSPTSCGRLEGWMAGSQTGLKRLRAGLPPDWRVGDKTGSDGGGTVNDVAILRPPGREPVFAAVYVTGATARGDAYDRAYAEIGRLIAAAVTARSP